MTESNSHVQIFPNLDTEMRFGPKIHRPYTQASQQKSLEPNDSQFYKIHDVFSNFGVYLRLHEL